jgi:hypothetical protein
MATVHQLSPTAEPLSTKAQPTCATRAVKVLKYVRREAPAAIPRSSVDELENLPTRVLANFHSTSDWSKVTKDEQLRDWLAANPVPGSRAKASGPLFSGTLVFAQLQFQVAGQPPSAIATSDVQTALDYASLALIPMQRYISQYGNCDVGAWPDVIPFPVNLPSASFTVSTFETWVDEIAQTASNSKASNPCVVILHNRDLPGAAQFTGNRNSFHGMTGNGTPYCYCLVFTQNLTIADPGHFYADKLSHEIAEMIVDPKADDSNPEVCDPCAGNCNNIWFNLFDNNGVYIGGTTDPASAQPYKFFINPIVSGAVAVNGNGCIASGAAAEIGCVYPPPFVAGELFSYADDSTPGNVSAPILVGFGGWLPFKFLFAGENAAGENRIYAVNSDAQLLSYGDDGAQGNVSDPVEVGFGGWLQFKFLFAGQNDLGQNRIYAVNSSGQLLSYGDDGTPGNVSAPVEVGFGGWSDFKFLFAGQNDLGQNRIYAVNSSGQLLSYGDDGTPGNVSAPVEVGFDDWLDFSYLFAGRNLAGQNRVYAVPA